MNISSRVACSLVLGACSFGANGCLYRSWDIAPQQLSRVNGYRAPQQLELKDKDGDSVVFNSDTELNFGPVAGGPEQKGRFSAVEVNGSLFSGTTPGGMLRVDLASVRPFVGARRYDPGRTAALIIPLSVGGTAVLLLVGTLVFGMALGGLAGVG